MQGSAERLSDCRKVNQKVTQRKTKHHEYEQVHRPTYAGHFALYRLNHKRTAIDQFGTKNRKNGLSGRRDHHSHRFSQVSQTVSNWFRAFSEFYFLSPQSGRLTSFAQSIGNLLPFSLLFYLC